MEKVKAGLRGANAETKLARASIVLEHLTGNPNFPSPVPSLTELAEARDALANAIIAARDRGRLACENKRLCVARMDRILSRLAAYVNSAGNGNSWVLLNSGFELVRRAEPQSSLVAPRSITYNRPPYAGQIDLRWSRVPGALVYELEIGERDGVNGMQWHRVGLTSRPRYLVTGLEPNSVRTFRVRAIGTRIEGPYGMLFDARVAS